MRQMKTGVQTKERERESERTVRKRDRQIEK